MEEVRKGWVVLFGRKALKRAAELEAELHRRHPEPDAYRLGCLRALEGLGRRLTDFPDGLAANFLSDGRLEPAAFLDSLDAPEPARTPRAELRQRFVACLFEGDERFRADRARAQEVAEALERACYNQTIDACSENAIPRAWTSPAFVCEYSERCGRLLVTLDRKSRVCTAYGAGVLEALAAGELDPAGAGALSARELVPSATEEIERGLAVRRSQRVQEKWSTLFQCPRCGERKCTYVTVQLRSLDEPASHICVCQCEHRWTC